MKHLLQFSLFLVLSFSFSLAHCEEVSQGEILQIENVQISGAKWTFPEDGSTPQLLSYDLSMHFSDEQILKGTQFSNKDFPMTTWKKGNFIEVIKEGFYSHGDKSLFLIRHVDSGIEVELEGKSRNKRVFFSEYNEPDIYEVRRVELIGNSVHFDVKETHFALPVENIKYHNFYFGMPLKIVNENRIEMPFEKYVLEETFIDVRTGEQFVANSTPLTTNPKGVVKAVKVSHVTVERRFGNNIYHYQLAIVLEDGDTLFGEKEFLSYYTSPYDLDPQNYAYQPGDNIEIMAQVFCPRDPWNSFFTINNVRSGEVSVFKGVSRKPRASDTIAYNDNKIVRLKYREEYDDCYLGKSEYLFPVGSNSGLYEDMLFALVQEKEIDRNDKWNQNRVRVELFNFETQQMMTLDSYWSQYSADDERLKF